MKFDFPDGTLEVDELAQGPCVRIQKRRTNYLHCNLDGNPSSCFGISLKRRCLQYKNLASYQNDKQITACQNDKEVSKGKGETHFSKKKK
ncbi:hypothetical protein TorRG33x02_022340 [Trema orientale]|uniref:Uncharacterized protein n=1 Tax=Trema orientale TaxID=63057 RepID=A0A2P5FVX6_TREOI|nr:hypothetical protein TorRG33x02_022340 [Trema orientale]